MLCILCKVNTCYGVTFALSKFTLFLLCSAMDLRGLGLDLVAKNLWVHQQVRFCLVPALDNCASPATLLLFLWETKTWWGLHMKDFCIRICRHQLCLYCKIQGCLSRNAGLGTEKCGLYSYVVSSRIITFWVWGVVCAWGSLPSHFTKQVGQKVTLLQTKVEFLMWPSVFQSNPLYLLPNTVRLQIVLPPAILVYQFPQCVCALIASI